MRIRNFLPALLLILFTAGLAHADLGDFIRRVNDKAATDLARFKAQLESHFRVPAPEVEVAVRAADTPAEAAVLLWLKARTARPLNTVVEVYRRQKGQGWGAIAQSLGIKPGSDDFHALKQGNLGWEPEGAAQPEKGGGNGHGKGKGKK